MILDIAIGIILAVVILAIGAAGCVGLIKAYYLLADNPRYRVVAFVAGLLVVLSIMTFIR